MAYQVDNRLLNALIQQESRGNNNARSPKGALGLAQVMPETARNPGFGVQPLRSSDAPEQVRFANDYLGAMINKYKGDIPKALAAYNAGPGAVDKYNGIPPYKETQNYVGKILTSLNPISAAQASEQPYRMTRAEFRAQEQQQAGLQQYKPVMSRAEFRAQEQQGQPVQYEGRNVEDMGAASKFLTGTGNKVLDLVRGAAQLTGVAGDTGFGSQQDIEQSRQLSKELGKSTSGTLGNVAGDVLPFVLTGGGSTVPQLVAKSAAIGALAPTKGTESRAINVANSAIGGAVGAGIGAGLSKAVKGFAPSADAKALMDIGVQPTVGQGIKQNLVGKAIRKTEEAATSIPFIGAIPKYARDRALGEWTKQAIKQAESPSLGVSAKGATGHEAIANLKSTFGAAYTKAMEGHTLPLRQDLVDNIGNAIKDPANFINDAERKTITKGLQGLFDKIQPNEQGKYLASDLFKVESKLKSQISALPVGDAKRSLLTDVRSILTKYREDNLPSDVGKTLKTLNSKYANFIRLREASKGVGAEHGEFSPTQLYNRATMLDKSGKAAEGNALMQKISGQGKAVLSDKLGESGTGPRTMLGNLLGFGAPVAAYTNPIPTAIAGVGMLAGSTRPVQKALLGGYSGQNLLAKRLGMLKTPGAALGAASATKKDKNK